MTIWSGVTPISSSSSRVRNCCRSGRKPCGVPLDRKWLPGCRPRLRSAPDISSPSSHSFGRKPQPGALWLSAEWNMLRSSQVTSILRMASEGGVAAVDGCATRSRT
ncbi:hypothetical protein D3C86_1470990 [compost metagenome]